MSNQQNAPVTSELIVAAFQDEKGADEALHELKMAKWNGLIGIQDAAIIRRDKKNKLHIKETGDWGGGKGAAVGADVLTEANPADIHEQLAAGGEVSYTALAGEGGLETTRTAVSDEKVETSASILSGVGFCHEEAIATENGVAAERMVINAEGNDKESSE